MATAPATSTSSSFAPAAVSAEDPVWRGQLESLSRDLARWTGNHVGLSEVGEEQIEALVATPRPVVSELQQDAITLAGPDVDRLLAEAA
jgi:hypothetical protein